MTSRTHYTPAAPEEQALLLLARIADALEVIARHGAEGNKQLQSISELLNSLDSTIHASAHGVIS